MQQYPRESQLIKDILGITREPVATTLIRDETQLQEIDVHSYDAVSKCRYCQAVMRASRGEKVILSADNLACAAAAAAFGLKSLHPKLASGAGHYNVGTFGTQSAAHKMMSDMPRLALGDYKYILASPLNSCEYQPDVILVEAEPEKLMWLVLAAIYTTGERLQFSTSVVQANCVDATVVPFTTGQPNATLGCTGCREATDLAVTENLVGIPFSLLPMITENLQNMQDMMAKNRSKNIYKRFVNGQ